MSDKMHMIAHFTGSDAAYYFAGEDRDYDKWANRGDQTGIEANVRNFTDGRGSGGWGHVYRFRNKSIRDKIAEVQVAQCTNGYLGYNQGTGKYRYKNRGSVLRAMCAAQLGVDLDEWHDAGVVTKPDGTKDETGCFGVMWDDSENAPAMKDGKLNYAKVDLRKLSPWDVGVECGTDCSMSAHNAINIAINLWRHAYYTPTNSYNRWWDTQPSNVFNMIGGGASMAKSFKLMCAGKETEPVNMGSSYSNKTLPCDGVKDEFIPFSETERIKELGFDLSNYENPENPGFFQNGIILRHVWFKPGTHDRAKTYRYNSYSCYYSATPNTPQLDAKGKRIRQVMYAYCVADAWSCAPAAIPDGGTETGTDGFDGDTTAYTRYEITTTPCMDHYIAAMDGKTLLKAVYDSKKQMKGWEAPDGTSPWKSTIHCKSWDGAPMFEIYATPAQQYAALVGGDTTVTPVKRARCDRLYRPRNMTENAGVWSAYKSFDAMREYVLFGGYNAASGTYEVGDDDDSKCGNRDGWERGSDDTGRFSRVRKQYIYMPINYNSAVKAARTAAGLSTDCFIKIVPLTSGNSTVWAFFASDGYKTTNKRYGNVCWIMDDTGTVNQNDAVFPFFAVQECAITDELKVTFNNVTYDFPAEFAPYDPVSNSGGYLYYYANAESTGSYYFVWKHTYKNDSGETVTDVYIQDWKTENISADNAQNYEGSDDPTVSTEWVVFWAKKVGDSFVTTEQYIDPDTGAVSTAPISPPFGDGSTMDVEDGEYEKPINGTLLHVISSPVNLERGDFLLTRAGSERTAASSGGHAAVYV